MAELRGKRIEEELGLTGSEDEALAIQRVQAAERGRQSRQHVSELRGQRIEQELGLTGSETETAHIARLQVIPCALLVDSFSAISRAHPPVFSRCSPPSTSTKSGELVLRSTPQMPNQGLPGRPSNVVGKTARESRNCAANASRRSSGLMGRRRRRRRSRRCKPRTAGRGTDSGSPS